MRSRLILTFVLILLASAIVYSQRPGNVTGRPGGGPPPHDGRPMPRDGSDRPAPPPSDEWVRPHDLDGNGNLDADEFRAAIERTFAELDRNKNGTIEPGEAIKPPQPDQSPRPRAEGERPGQPSSPRPAGARILPPFFFMDRTAKDATYSRAEFEQIVRNVFGEMDKNSDGILTRDEARRLPPRQGFGPPPVPNMAPNAKFIGAELRFGDKLIKGQPFSADIVIEDTKRLFDGTTVTRKSRGAVYRDGEGRTRREQSIEMVGGVGIVGTDNKPPTIVFISDFASRSQIFLDLNAKVARKTPLGPGPGPIEPRPRGDAREESLGTKTIDGVAAEGTRISFEIPAGKVGNDKPLQVVTERWFSTELGLLVMSRHLDPVAGEHLFKLVNIKRVEPNPSLFSIPAGFKIENSFGPRPKQ